MNDLGFLITSIVDRIGFAILHSIWIFALVAIVGAVLLRMIPTTYASFRHNIAIACLVLMLSSWCALLVLAPAQPERSNDVSEAARIATTSHQPSETHQDHSISAFDLDRTNEKTSAEIANANTDRSRLPNGAAAEVSSHQARSIPIPALLKTLAVFGWLVGIAILGIRRVISFFDLIAFHKQCQSIECSKLVSKIERLKSQVGLSMRITVLQSRQLIAPVVFGWLRPTLVLPISFASGIPAAQVDAIIAHELAHIRRRDFVIKLFQLFVESLFFYHPATWWISRQIQIERESCCDNVAVESGTSALDLAEAIAMIESQRHKLALAFGDTNTSASRVHRLLAMQQSRKSFSMLGSVMFAFINLAIFGIVGIVSLSSLSLAAPAAASSVESPVQEPTRQLIYFGNQTSWSARYLRNEALELGYAFEPVTFSQSDDVTEEAIRQANEKLSHASVVVIGDERWQPEFRPVEETIKHRVESGDTKLVVLGKQEKSRYSNDSPLISALPVENYRWTGFEYFPLRGQFEISNKSLDSSFYSIVNCDLREDAEAIATFSYDDKTVPIISRIQNEQTTATFVGISGLYRLRQSSAGKELFADVGQRLIETVDQCERIMLLGKGNSWDLRMLTHQWKRAGVEVVQFDPEQWNSNQNYRKQAIDELNSAQILIATRVGFENKLPEEFANKIRNCIESKKTHLVVFSKTNGQLPDNFPENLSDLLPISTKELGLIRPAHEAVLKINGGDSKVKIYHLFRSVEPKPNASTVFNMIIDSRSTPLVVESKLGEGNVAFVATNELWRFQNDQSDAYSTLWKHLIEPGELRANNNHLQEDDIGLENPTFEDWEDDMPVGWDVSVGATNGADEPLSDLYSDGAALVLEGDSTTRAWRFIKQTVELEAGKTYRLTCETKAEGIRRQGIQFNNCYVGLFFKDRRGEIISNQIENVPESDWETRNITFRVPDNATHGDVAIFLSKTGKLTVKNFGLREFSEEDSFQILVDEMDQRYSFFDHKGIDWEELTERYRDRAELARTNREFCNVVAEMLAELEDIHTWTRLPSGKRVTKYSSSHQPNYDLREVKKQLNDTNQVAKGGLVGRTDEGYGYVAVTTLVDKKAIDELADTVKDMFDAPGFIVDLRLNNGGSETLAGTIAQLFADEKRVYAKSVFRSGPNHDDFCDPIPRHIAPRGDSAFTKPVICLIGPGCVSSGEGFAMMMKCFPHVKLIGQPTRGASGNPGVLSLPNGVEIGYSRWMSLLPDGTPIESVGIPPDLEIEHEGGDGDSTFEQAIGLLTEMIEERK